VSDGKMLRLIKAWLKTPVEETDERGNRRMTGGKGSRMGTPQDRARPRLYSRGFGGLGNQLL
jgi:hypothetical protein